MRTRRTNQAFHWVMAGGDTDAAFDAAEVVVKERILHQRLIPNAMGAALGRRAVDGGLRRADALEHDPEPAHRAVPHLGRHRGRGAQDQGDRARGRRRVRQQDPVLRRRGHRRVLRDENRPADQVDGHAQRGLPGHDSRPRPRRGDVELAADKSGKITGLRSTVYAGMGGYLSTAAPGIPTILHGLMYAGTYTIPNVKADVYGVFNNGAPVEAYRGAGRPEGDLPRREDGRQARRRVGHGPGRRAARQPHPGVRRRTRHRHRADLRQRRLRGIPGHGAGGGRLQGPAREAGAPARRGPVPRHRRVDLRGDMRARPVPGRGSRPASRAASGRAP